MFALAILAVIVGSLYFLWIFQHRVGLAKRMRALNAKELPGSNGLPLIGTLHQIASPTWIYLQKKIPIYGPLFKMRVGLKDYVVLSDYPTVKRAFVDQGLIFSERFHSKFHDMIVRKSGITIMDYSKIGEHKKFLLRSLREYGFGPTAPLEAAIIELEYIRDWISQNVGKPANPITTLRKIFSNMVSAIAFDQRLGAEDEDFERQIIAITKFMETENIMKNPLNFYPFLNHLLFLFIRLPFFRQSLAQWDQVHEYIEKKLLTHQASMKKRGVVLQSDGDAASAPAAPPESFLDLYLLELERTTRKAQLTGCEPDFTFEDVREVMLELFFTGTDTSSMTMLWAFWLMALYPAEQQRVHDEIIRAIGADRPPYNSDKSQLNYCHAVIDEALRISSLAPLGIMHRCKEDTNLDGYFVAKDSLVLSNFYAIHRDPAVWRNATEFHPENFLDPDTGNYQPHPELLAFSIGKRDCLGKGLARLDLYIMFVGVFQKFRVRLPDAWYAEVGMPKTRRFTVADLDRLVQAPGIDGVLRTARETDFIFEKYEN